jgi:hypothetical protein
LIPNQAPAMKTNATANTQKICFTRRTAKIHDTNLPNCHEGNWPKSQRKPICFQTVDDFTFAFHDFPAKTKLFP